VLNVDGHSGSVNGTAFNRAGTRLYSVGNDKTVREWEIPSGRALRVFRPESYSGKDGMLNAVACSPDGDTLAVAGYGNAESDPYRIGEILLIDLQTESVRRMGYRKGTAHINVVNSLGFSADGKTLISTSADGTVREWDVAGASAKGDYLDVAKTLGGSDPFVMSASLNQAGELAAGGWSGRSLAIWPANRKGPRRVREGAGARAHAAARLGAALRRRHRGAREQRPQGIAPEGHERLPDALHVGRDGHARHRRRCRSTPFLRGVYRAAADGLMSAPSVKSRNTW